MLNLSIQTPVNVSGRLLLILWCLLLAGSTVAFSQTTSTPIDGVSEPPELTGEPKKFNKPSDADSQLFEIIEHLKDQGETKSTLPKLDDFIRQHPGYSDAYFLRATCKACILDSSEFTSIANDVSAAMSYPGANVYNKTDGGNGCLGRICSGASASNSRPTHRTE
jgi:hypothetical protein